MSLILRGVLNGIIKKQAVRHVGLFSMSNSFRIICKESATARCISVKSCHKAIPNAEKPKVSVLNLPPFRDVFDNRPEHKAIKMAPMLSIEEAKSFLKSKRYLLSTPNVVSLGFINEKIDGNKTGAKTFRVGVIKKQSKENIKDPDIFVPKFFEHSKSNSNEVIHIPVKVVEEGELELLTSVRDANPGNDGPYKGATLIQTTSFQQFGCLGANAQYQGTYRLLSAAHVLTNFDPDGVGNKILVQNNEGEFVKIDATVSGHVDVPLYDNKTEPSPEFAKQDLAWADITEREGSPEIEKIGVPTAIRSVKDGERVKYYGGYSAERGKNVEVEDIMVSARLKIFTSTGIKYGYFGDVCRINPKKSRLDKGDSGTAIVAEDDNALLGILMAKGDDSSCYFCKLELES